MKRIFTQLFFFSFIVLNAQDYNVAFKAKKIYPGQNLANVWGYTDQYGNEYALVGASNGLSIVNITNPASPYEIVQIPGPVSNWREVKVWDHYAYVTTEGGSSGLQIIDLKKLPGGNLDNKYWSPAINGYKLRTIHALHIDDGFAYLYGHNIGNKGCVIADLSDPWNPTYAGMYDGSYIHDGYVRDKKLYGSHVFSGHFSVMDVSNPTNPVILQTQNTPTNFTHNTWLSDDSKTLFTTDENSNSYLATYDLSDINNIKELDKIQATPGTNSIVHNTHIKNDWALTSWYRDGFTIVDGHRPDNLIEVGRYDTYAGSGDGFDGCWGVYPFFPSGNIVATDIKGGLYVLTPDYVRACYLEGIVSDSTCGDALNNVKIEILLTNASDNTDLAGEYKTGYHVPGTYSVKISKSGYVSRTINNVQLTPGVVTDLNVSLLNANPSSSWSLGGSTIDNDNQTGIAGVSILLDGTNSYSITSDAQGNFSTCKVAEGTYTISAASWGYRLECFSKQLSSTNNVLDLELEKAYYDDFSTDLGWTRSGNATTGKWERGKPVGTLNGSIQSNPGNDASDDCSDKAFVTGNGGGTAGTDDVDNGVTILTSPTFDLTSYTNPFLSYERWFYAGGGSGTPNDSMVVLLSNGQNTVEIEHVLYDDPTNSTWVKKKIRIADYITPTANMKFTVTVADWGVGHIVEGGLDVFEVMDSIVLGLENEASFQDFKIYPNPIYTTQLLQYELPLEKVSLELYDISGRLIANFKTSALQGKIQLPDAIEKGLYLLKLRKEEKEIGVKLLEIL